MSRRPDQRWFVSPFIVLHSRLLHLACYRMHLASDDLFYLCCVCVQYSLLFGGTVPLQKRSKCFVVHSSKWTDAGALVLYAIVKRTLCSIPDKSFKPKQQVCSVYQTRKGHTAPFTLSQPYF